MKKTTKKTMMKNDYLIKHTFRRYLGPTILALLGTTFSSFGNTLLAGRFLGKDALAAMSLMSSFTFLYAMLGCLISIGAATRSSISMGCEDFETAAKYEWMSLVLSLAIPIIISVPCLIRFDALYAWLGGNEAAYAIGAGYGKLVIAFGFLNTLMYFPFNFLRLIGKGRYGMYSFGAMGIIDVILVYAFLKAGMGPVGIALGYILSMLLANVAGIYFLFTKNHLFKMKVPEAALVLRMLKNIAFFGSSAGLNNLCRMLRTVVLNRIVSTYLGDDGLASLAVGFSVINLASSSVTGFGQAISPMIGILHGERDRNGQRQTLKISIINAMAFHAIVAFVIVIFAQPIAGFFGISGSDHLADTALLVRLVAISLIPSAVINILIYYYSAIGENRCAMVMTIMHVLVFNAVLAAIHFSFDRSNWYALSFILAELLDIPVMVLYSMIRRKIRPDLCGVLLEDSSYSENFFMTVSDGSEEGAVKTSGEVVAFCEENDVSPALCLKLPLVVEELLVVMARHCKTDTSFKIDVRISLVEEEVVMRMRCPGTTFNPIEWFRDRKSKLSMEEFMEDESFGMNMVDKIVSKVKYSNVFDMNNLIVSMVRAEGKKKDE